MPSSGQDTDAQALEARRKRLYFRSQHRGTKEMDILVGRFAERHLAELSAEELDSFEALLDVPEPILSAWLISGAAPDPAFDGPVLQRLIAFEPVTKDP